MGIFDDIGDFFASGGDFLVHVGEDVYAATVDFNDWTVELEGELWSAIPGELLAPGLGPLAGLLKTKFGDDVFMMLGPAGIVTGLSIFPVQFDQAAQIALGGLSLLGVIKHRGLNDEEWDMAHWVFNGQLPPRENIRLTNLGVPDKGGGFFDRAITFPAISSQYYVNLGAKYTDRSSVPDAPLLIHELTHVWQGRNKVSRELQILAALNRKYQYAYGAQWADYGIEQQATIVQDWANGTIEQGVNQLDGTPLSAGPLSIGSPLFRYIYHNLRTNNDGAKSDRARSVRDLVHSANKAAELKLSKITSPQPNCWWKPRTSFT